MNTPNPLDLQGTPEARILRLELQGIREQRDAFAVKLTALRQERDAYRQAFADRTQALTESGDKLCRAENERDALRAVVAEVLHSVAQCYMRPALCDRARHLLATIPAPDLGPATVGGLVTLAGKAFPG